MDFALVVLSTGFFLLSRVANSNKVQRDKRSIDIQDFTYIIHHILAGMDSAPDGAQAESGHSKE
jgi:hypothetical protein